jgi:Icc protein
MRIIQITDPHIFTDTQQGSLLGLNTAKSFEAVLQLVESNAKSPDLIVLTGDLSQDETAPAYHHIAKSCERFKCPIYWIPGNHDNPTLMQKIFEKTQLHQEKAILLGNWLFILLNSHYPKHVEGLLAKTEFSHLEHYLSLHPKQHTLLFMHHPPVTVGSKWVDNLALKNADKLFAITDKFPQIKAIVCGHVHQEFNTTRKNIPIYTTPSTCIQFKSNSNNFALDSLNPGYRWFDLNSNGTFETGVERVLNFQNTVDFSSQGY